MSTSGSQRRNRESDLARTARIDYEKVALLRQWHQLFANFESELAHLVAHRGSAEENELPIAGPLKQFREMLRKPVEGPARNGIDMWASYFGKLLIDHFHPTSQAKLRYSHPQERRFLFFRFDENCRQVLTSDETRNRGQSSAGPDICQ